MKSRLKTSLLSVLTLSLLWGCGAPPALVAAEGQSLEAKRSTGKYDLIVLPQEGVSPILKAIQGARESVTLEMYLFTNYDTSAQLVNALIARAKAGVDVRVIIEAHPYTPGKADEPLPPNLNQDAIKALIGGGVRVKRSSPKFRYTHSKFMVIDSKVAYFMTLNFTNSAFSTNREYALADSEPTDVAEAARIFESDWQEEVFVPRDPDLVVSPHNSRQRLLELISSAKRSVTIQCEYLTDPQVVKLLGEKARSGVEVTLMIAYHEKDPKTGYDPNGEAKVLYDQAGLKRYVFSRSIKMHAKAILVDGTRAFLGSENLTANSLDNNREVGLLLDDKAVVSELLKVTQKDWDAQ